MVKHTWLGAGGMVSRDRCHRCGAHRREVDDGDDTLVLYRRPNGKAWSTVRPECHFGDDTQSRLTLDEKVALWNEINLLVAMSGGEVSASLGRQDAVVKVERVVNAALMRRVAHVR